MFGGRITEQDEDSPRREPERIPFLALRSVTGSHVATRADVAKIVKDPKDVRAALELFDACGYARIRLLGMR